MSVSTVPGLLLKGHCSSPDDLLFFFYEYMQVLEELEDIIDLPTRAAAVEDLLAEGDGALVPAFEGLTVLEGTANNVKKAWSRWGVGWFGIIKRVEQSC